ncbi:MAG: hypothetical protein AAF307_05520 [Pseudomonadota bacterium]
MIHPDIERMTADDLAALQSTRLAEMGARLAESLDWSALRAGYLFPFLTVPVERIDRFMSTSGPTGLPVMFGTTRTDYHVRLKQQMARVLSAAGVMREIRARLGIDADVECTGPGTLPRYEAKATRVLHRASEQA